MEREGRVAPSARQERRERALPSNWLYIDTNFPAFTQRESADEKIETMQDYLFMLVEQLRYSLRNLDLRNMNGKALDGFLQSINEPIYARIEDEEGRIHELGLTAEGLSARLTNAEGNITQLGATAEGLSARVSDAEGNISSLTQTAEGLQAQVRSLNGSVTNLTVDVNGLRATVSGKIDGSEAQTLINQTINGITLAATSSNSGTVFKLSSGGVEIASTGSIDLHVKSVNIDGDVTAAALIGDSVAIKYREYGLETVSGYITTNATTTGGGLGIASLAGLRMTAGSNSNVYLASNAGNGGGFITLYPTFVQLGGGALVIGSGMYGNVLPSSPTQGTLYFLRKSA